MVLPSEEVPIGRALEGDRASGNPIQNEDDALPRLSSRKMGRVFLLLAALVLLLVQGTQSFITLDRESRELQQFGESTARSASLAMSTPLWLMAGDSLADIMSSYVSFGSVDRVVIYEGEDPWLAYDRELGLVGDVSGETGDYDEIDPGDLGGGNPFARLEEPIRFDGERIGSVAVVLNDSRIAAARRRTLLRTSLFVIAEVIIIFALMRLRGNQILTESLARMNESLRRFVPDQFLRFLRKEDISDIKLGDHTEETMAVVFLDIRSFTSLSEKLSPEENFDFINSFLGHMGPIVRRHGGFVDKYLGDGLMALFPNSVNDAVAAAVDLRRERQAFNDTRRAHGMEPVDFGIGIHTGGLMLGTIGETLRMDSTVISPVVNLSSRLEGLTKEFGIGIVVSDLVAEQVGKETWEMRYLGRVSVKGTREPVEVYEVYEGEEEPVRRLRTASKPHFESGVRAAVAGDYSTAIAEFRGALKEYPDDPAPDYYLRLVGSGGGLQAG